jgi:branched-chain amino acid transport system substrate-binding protein
MNAQAKPLRIGLLQTLSGPLRDLGTAHVAGLRVAARHLNNAGGIGARPVELLVRDTKADPAEVANILRGFALDGVNLVIGEVFAHIVEVIEPMLPALGIVNVSPTMTGINATHDWFNRHFFRCGANGHMQFGGQALLLARRVPEARRWGGIVGNYLGARVGYGSFTDTLRQHYRDTAGRAIEIVDPVLADPGTTDFAALIAQLRAQALDALHIGLWGGEAVAFLQQAGSTGLLRGYRAVADTTLNILAGPPMGNTGPEHFWSACLWWPETYGHLPLARAFAQAMQAETGEGIANSYAASAHTALLSLAAAVAAAGSSATGDVIAALESVPFDSVYGALRYRRDDHQLLVDPGYLRIAPSGAGYQNAEHVVIPVAETIEPPSPGVAFEP